MSRDAEAPRTTAEERAEWLTDEGWRYMSQQDLRRLIAHAAALEAEVAVLREADPYRCVAEFHDAFGLPTRAAPIADIPERKLREALLQEEFLEYLQASKDEDIVEIADALADMVVVIYGTALAHGIPLDAVFTEVHRSNMTKLGLDGKPIRREDGKVMKGPNFEPPNIRAALAATEEDAHGE